MKSRCNFASGLLNLILAALIFTYALFLVLCTAVFGITIINPFLFLPAIVGTIMFGFATGVSFFLAFLNAVCGIGSVALSFKGGRLAKAFSIASIIVDAVFLCAGCLALVFSILLLCEEADGVSIALLIMVLAAIGLAVASICVSCRAHKRLKQTI